VPSTAKAHKGIRPLKKTANINFLPKGREGGGVLPWVIGVMTFLTALALSGSFGIYNASQKWASELSSSLSVQIVHDDADERARQAERALSVLSVTPGILSARLVPMAEIQGLLEPWLGAGNVSDDLPIPALISVQLQEGRYVDLTALEARLQNTAPNASVDSHQRWIAQFSRLSGAVQVGVGVVVFLIMLTTIAIVIFATHARLASHRDNIEIIYLIGAEERLITNEFKRHFLRYGLKGGIGGLVASALAIAGMFWLTSSMGGELAPQLELGIFQILILLSLPIIVALLSMATASTAIRRALEKLV